ncbi:Cyclomaltodextrinase [compost metagenome]
MSPWSQDATFYQIYPLGALGAPERNPGGPPVPRLERLHGWLPALKNLGITALYLGPLFESTAHGYDTADYMQVDRRLGSNDDLAHLCAAAHAHGMRVVLDAVFHHVGRDFWAFRDVLARGSASPYAGWFHLDFQRRSPQGDPFFYEGWNGHYDLVKLDTSHPAVREHLFGAVNTWVDAFGIDGLRLDAADVLDKEFQRALAAHCKQLRPDFWLLGEVIHGDYRDWVNPGMLDAVTNYELYKGLYSSHNDRNYFEVAHSLNRQFGPGGLYQDLTLYTFVDNHDVERIASQLKEAAHLYPLYTLLFTVPGIPSLYYGSEWGIEGRKAGHSDAPLRPAFSPAEGPRLGKHADLAAAIVRLSQIRSRHPALRHGTYRTLHVASEQFAFIRETPEESIVVAVNAASSPAELRLPLLESGRWTDLLNPGEGPSGETLTISPSWGRILRAG